MAKVQQKSEKITAFGGIFIVLDKFDLILSSVIDSHLGLRSTLTGYQYSEIIRAVFSVFCCGGDCMEDLNLYLKDVQETRLLENEYSINLPTRFYYKGGAARLIISWREPEMEQGLD